MQSSQVRLPRREKINDWEILVHKITSFVLWLSFLKIDYIRNTPNFVSSTGALSAAA